MGISIYYTAKRDQPLSVTERAAVDRLITEYSISDQVERRIQTGHGHNGMNFFVYDPERPSEPGVIFEGATQLPSNDDDALLELIQHWCRLLSAIRVTLEGTTWHVHVDDHDIQWDDTRQGYDPAA